MSLWSLPLESLTFQQLDEFLSAGLPESNRLDYKVDMPKDLAKIIAAFANTLGGLVVLGVDEEPTTTKPVWPPHPTTGREMKSERGLRERVTQIARDAIFPPVSIRISPVIENPHLSGKALLVVRVDESKDAPHAIDRREVYIYERDGATSSPLRLAEIDRVAYLLNRRRQFEEDREQMIRVEIDRASRLLPASKPLFWAAVVPFYPWRQLCATSLCYKLHCILPQGTANLTFEQQMPDGSYRRGLLRELEGANQAISCSRLSSKGLVFEMESPAEQGVQEPGRLNLKSMEQLLRRVIENASQLYQSREMELPGYLMVSVGLLHVRGAHLHLQNIPPSKSRHPFLDDLYRVDHFTDCEALLNSPYKAGAHLLEEIIYAFDMPPISKLHEEIEERWGSFSS